MRYTREHRTSPLFLWKLSDWIKSYGPLSKILAYLVNFLPDLSLIIFISCDYGSNFEQIFISPGFPINFRKSHRISKNYLKSAKSYGQKSLVGPQRPPGLNRV